MVKTGFHMDTEYTYNFGDPGSDRNQARLFHINKMEPSVVVLAFNTSIQGQGSKAGGTLWVLGKAGLLVYWSLAKTTGCLKKY